MVDAPFGSLQPAWNAVNALWTRDFGCLSLARYQVLDFRCERGPFDSLASSGSVPLIPAGAKQAAGKLLGEGKKRQGTTSEPALSAVEGRRK
jgi:hypothetical protein